MAHVTLTLMNPGQPMRRVVFFGNCYAYNLSQVYELAFAPDLRDTCTFVSSYLTPSEDDLELLTRADVIVAQVFDVDQKLNFHDVSSQAELVHFPQVSQMSLWPFGNVAHPQNAALPHWLCGPFDTLMGDGYLNRRLVEGASPEVAVRDYLRLDIAKTAHLDRLHEITMDRQRMRDEKCGMEFANEIERHFRSERLFLNHFRPNVRMAASLARQVFRRLGVADAAIDRVVACWTKTPFERTELPIHPATAEHFGLSYGHADETYLYHTGERLTFEEFAIRYATFRWNDPLLRGVATGFWPGGPRFEEFQQGVEPDRLDAAIAELRDGLATSSGSALGQRTLGDLLLRRGQRDAARASAELAVRRDPDDVESQLLLGRLLQEDGGSKEAPQALRAAIRADPWHPGGYERLSSLLASRGELDEAVSVLEELLRVQPARAFLHYDLGRLLVSVGRLADAEGSFRRAMEMLPSHPRPRLYLADVLLTQDPASLEGGDLLAQARLAVPVDPGLSDEIHAVEVKLSAAA